MNRAVFVDRDGTISRDVPYCSRPEDFELLPGVAEGIRLLNEQGFKVVVVTNQSGIARGYFTEEMLARIHDKMRSELAKQPAHVDAIYYCPHHPDDNCQCRKPKTGLLEQATEELQLDLHNSYFIGDRLHDMLAGKKIGCKAVLVPSSETEPELLNRDYPDKFYFVHEDFYYAAKWIVSQTERT